MADAALIDSSLLYALHDPDDRYHLDAIRFTSTYKGTWIVPEVALVEVTQVLYRFVSQQAVLKFLDSLDRPQISLQSLTQTDLKRAREIMANYSESRLDFVDCCIMALAERLNMTQVCTFDRRDFSIFRPSHTDFLELLP
jgi:predicted nucleic acid-binding protein